MNKTALGTRGVWVWVSGVVLLLAVGVVSRPSGDSKSRATAGTGPQPHRASTVAGNAWAPQQHRPIPDGTPALGDPTKCSSSDAIIRELQRSGLAHWPILSVRPEKPALLVLGQLHSDSTTGEFNGDAVTSQLVILETLVRFHDELALSAVFVEGVPMGERLPEVPAPIRAKMTALARRQIEPTHSLLSELFDGCRHLRSASASNAAADFNVLDVLAATTVRNTCGTSYVFGIEDPGLTLRSLELCQASYSVADRIDEARLRRVEAVTFTRAEAEVAREWIQVQRRRTTLAIEVATDTSRALGLEGRNIALVIGAAHLGHLLETDLAWLTERLAGYNVWLVDTTGLPKNEVLTNWSANEQFETDVGILFEQVRSDPGLMSATIRFESRAQGR